MYLSNISRRFHCNLRKSSLISNIYLKYIQSNFLGTLVDIAQREKIPPICWENHGKNDNFPIYFDGVPYIFLGNRDYQCHQGKDRNITKKRKYKETRKDLARGVDHTQHIKTRKLSQPSKKLNCPVQFSVKKLYRFPEYKISKDTSWQRSSTSKKIKLVLQQLSIKKATTVDKVPGYLEYVTKFPKGNNSFDFVICDLFIYFCFLYYNSIQVKFVPSSLVSRII